MAFDVTAVLKANVSNFTSGIQEAQSVFEGFQSKSNRTFETISSGFQKVGTVLTAGLTAPTIAGIGAVVKSYADLEQNLGGTEAVFGSFAKTVQNDAQSAYKNMGLSASDYMGTANKMASLFQGSGIDQQRSLDLTSKAMKRASDVASVMGVDMGTAMESITGAAKGNFEMMDNLGVAMNATTLEAYALEKGINFKWDTASNAEKAELAMQMFMDRTQQFDGNFLKESESTVSGSLDAMKGAFSNFVAGLGNPEADVAQLMGNLMTTIQNFAKNVRGVVKTIWDNLPLAPWQKWVGLIAVGAGPVLLALSSIMKGVGTLKAAFQGISTVLANPWGLALVGLVALAAGLVHAYKSSEKFRNIVNGAVSAVTAKFNELKAKAQPALDYIKNALGKFNAGAFAPLIAGIGLFIASIMRLKGLKIPNPFSGLANMAKSASSSVKNVFSGLGKGIATIFNGVGSAVSSVFQGIARAISMLNPAGVASFAISLAAVTAALVALSAVQGMVLPFLQGLAQIFVQLVSGVLQGFASALVTLAPIMTTLASALAMLSPLVVAFGTAFSMVATAVGGAIAAIVPAISSGVAQIITALTPVVQIISTTFVQVVTVISQAIAQIIQAIAPFIPAITTMFTTITTVVANAIVQIIQALAPFIPAVTEMVTALAPVLSQIVQAFSNLVSQISPIIDSIGNLFKSLGTAIETVLSGASNVVNSFGNSIRTVLDGVAGIFESLGNSAKNAGAGVKLMAQGVATLTGLPLGDMAATLAAVAAGLAAIVASGIGFAGAGLQAAGIGMQIMATSAQMASSAIQMLPASLSLLTASLGTLPAMLTMAGASMTAFATSAQSSVAGLMIIGATITQFASMMLMIAPASATASAGLASFNGQASAAGSAMARLGAASASALGQITALGVGIASSMAGATASITMAASQMAAAIPMAGTQMTVTMQAAMNQIKGVVLNGMTASASAVRNGGTQMATAIASAGTQMTVTMQSAMNQVVNVVRNGMTNAASAVRNGASQMAAAMRSAGTQMVAAANSMVNQTVSAVRNGRGAMQSAGAYMAQGLAVGMRSALSEVTAAANQLVAQAEKAAQAKAKIHSPSRLFRDEVGWWIGAGISVGIDKSADMVAKSVDFIKDLASPLNSDILNAGDFALSDMQERLSSTISVSHTPQSVQHNINNTSNQQRLIDKIDELLQETRRGRVIYMDGKEVGRTVDRHLGQSTHLRSRTSWA